MNNNNDLEKIAKSSRRYGVVSLIGVIIVVASLVYSSVTLNQLQEDVDIKKEEIAVLETSRHQLEEHNIELERHNMELEERIRETIVIDKNRYEFEWGSLKRLATNHQTAQLIEDLLMMRRQNIPFKLGGNSPEAGFDSPNFVGFLLRKYERIENEFVNSEMLREMIPPTDEPKVGDIVFYETGYVMLYFRERGGRQFCIGMTPLGLAALDLNFGPRLIGYGRVE